jgi:hypothetical protein
MRSVANTMAALETQEGEPDSNLPKQDGVITVSIAVTQPVLSWVVH